MRTMVATLARAAMSLRATLAVMARPVARATLVTLVANQPRATLAAMVATLLAVMARPVTRAMPSLVVR